MWCQTHICVQPFFDLMTAKFNNAHEIEVLMALMQQLWDPAEAGGWLQDMNAAPPEGMSPKQVLLQVAIGDAQVSTLGAHVMARAYGAKTLSPQTRPIWGVDEVDGGYAGSVIVEWEYPDGATEPFENIPPDKDLDTHECPRRESAAQEQMVTFFEQGIVEQTCEGRCVSQRTGLCD